MGAADDAVEAGQWKIRARLSAALVANSRFNSSPAWRGLLYGLEKIYQQDAPPKRFDESVSKYKIAVAAQTSEVANELIEKHL